MPDDGQPSECGRDLNLWMDYKIDQVLLWEEELSNSVSAYPVY